MNVLLFVLSVISAGNHRFLISHTFFKHVLWLTSSKDILQSMFCNFNLKNVSILKIFFDRQRHAKKPFLPFRGIRVLPTRFRSCESVFRTARKMILRSWKPTTPSHLAPMNVLKMLTLVFTTDFFRTKRMSMWQSQDVPILTLFRLEISQILKSCDRGHPWTWCHAHFEMCLKSHVALYLLYP